LKAASHQDEICNFLQWIIIVATVGSIRVAAGEKKARNSYTRFISKLSAGGFYILIGGLLPALILPFSPMGALVIFLIGAGNSFYLAWLNSRLK
jgi:hypothetical protein